MGILKNNKINFSRKYWRFTRTEKFTFFLFLYAFFIMLFFTQSSPFFRINNWNDANAFFTVGKGMDQGLIPYKDLFEQKGPLLYFIYAVASLISHQSFFGVYLLESACMFVNLFMSFKIARLYLQWLPSVLISLFFPIMILNESSFYYGGSAEEFAIPLIMLFIFLLLRHYQMYSGEPFSNRFYIAVGLISGCLLWIKFTFLGGCLGFYVSLLIMFIWKRKWKFITKAITFTLIGLLATSLPWFIYFGIHHALQSLFSVYFKFNLSVYSSQLTIPDKLINSALVIGSAFNKNVESKIMIFIGMADFLLTWKYFKSRAEKWTLFSFAVGLLLGVYIGGREYVYYFLIVTPLTLLGLIAVGRFLQQSKHFQLDSESSNERGRWMIIICTAMVATYLCFGYNTNIQDSRFFIKKIPVQMKFAKIIDRSKNPTLLNYGSLDGGFYLAANLLPNVRYFERQNIDPKLYPENMDLQRQYLKQGRVQFVVVQLNRYINRSRIQLPDRGKLYHLVNRQIQKLRGRPVMYLLYQKK